jgi:hypothetical protein
MIIKSTSEPFNFAARQSFDARSEMQIQFLLLWIFTLSSRRRSLFLSAPDDKAVLISLALSQSNAYDLDCDYHELYIIIICAGSLSDQGAAWRIFRCACLLILYYTCGPGETQYRMRVVI